MRITKRGRIEECGGVVSFSAGGRFVDLIVNSTDTHINLMLIHIMVRKTMSQ